MQFNWKNKGKEDWWFSAVTKGAAGGRGMATGRNQEAPCVLESFIITVKATVLLQGFFILEKSR